MIDTISGGLLGTGISEVSDIPYFASVVAIES
jgi:hypothetical protein